MHDNMTATLNKPGVTHQTAPMTEWYGLTEQPGHRSHHVYSSSLGLTGHGRVRRRERVERRSQTVRKLRLCASCTIVEAARRTHSHCMEASKLVRPAP